MLVRRQRIPMPDPARYTFYDIIDLNIGKEPEMFGRVYKIVDCDKFTRQFLNRMGIAVPDPIDIPKDPYSELHKKASTTTELNTVIATIPRKRAKLCKPRLKPIGFEGSSIIQEIPRHIFLYRLRVSYRYITVRLLTVNDNHRKHSQRNQNGRPIPVETFWNTTNKCFDFMVIGTIRTIFTVSCMIFKFTIFSLIIRWRLKRTYHQILDEIPVLCFYDVWRYQR